MEKIYREWRGIWSKLQAALGPKYDVTEYITVDKKTEINYLYIISNVDHELIPIPISSECSLETVKEALHNPIIELPLQKGTGVNYHPSQYQLQQEKVLDLELAIMRHIVSLNTPNEFIDTRLISPIANEFLYCRHVLFEREGAFITALRDRGAWSIGETQELQRQLFTNGIWMEDGILRVDEELAQQWIEIRSLVLEGTTQERQVQAKDELIRYGEECVYFASVREYLHEHSDNVTAFMQSSLFEEFAPQFMDRHLASVGSTNQRVAESMLAGIYLLSFEGNGDVNRSPSQQFLASIPGYHDDITTFIRKHIGLQLPLAITSRQDALRDVRELITFRPFSSKTLDEMTKQTVLTKAKESQPKIVSQLRNNTLHKRGVAYLRENLDLVVDEEMRMGLFAVLIGNFGMARAKNEHVFTASFWFHDTKGYLNRGIRVPQFGVREDNHPTATTIEDALRVIFMDQGDGKGAYLTQARRIERESGTVIRFLQSDARVPHSVQELFSTITSPELSLRILEQFEDISVQDPLIVNRFFPEGITAFQDMVIARETTDFLRGIETHLIAATKPIKDKVGRATLGGWKNYDFSSLPTEILDRAITRTLQDGEHRIRILNHSIGEKRTTWKDWQEYMEKVFGWDTYDMKFLRHENFWNIWNTLGGAWDCICFSRKTLFNPRILQQY